MCPPGQPSATGRPPTGPAGPSAPVTTLARSERELHARRHRLTERLTAMQLDLGGLYYEMAIRDHIRTDVLTRKAAEMQRVDAELHQVERLLQRTDAGRAPLPAS